MLTIGIPMRIFLCLIGARFEHSEMFKEMLLTFRAVTDIQLHLSQLEKVQRNVADIQGCC
jgi:hypothetical protein